MQSSRKLLLLLVILTLPALLILAGCACKRCEQEQDRILVQWGEPEQTELQQDSHLFTETWYYWEVGRTVIFLWDDRECSCDASTYTFTPEEGEGARATENAGSPKNATLAGRFHSAPPHPYRP